MKGWSEEEMETFKDPIREKYETEGNREYDTLTLTRTLLCTADVISSFERILLTI